jgi:hypothetical protein
MTEKRSEKSYHQESTAKGGSVPPDKRRNSKARSQATQEEHMGGHNKAEQTELQRERAQQRDFEIDQESERY